MLCFHSASNREGEDFFNRFWPEARAVSDPQKVFYSAFELKSGSLREIFGPGVWLKALGAFHKGYSPGKVIGNAWLMPGIFYVEHREIRWSWKYRNIGDHPDFSAIPLLLK